VAVRAGRWWRPAGALVVTAAGGEDPGGAGGLRPLGLWELGASAPAVG